ncbi:hypothetical protein [Burkholderia lata]|uniref:hypothetical protein n=1 Tax=Burkholderia lata (strain ATCC 17760 / DSM 23089 / LMG 22485 / NCIMB 9086 / R18194 / 383) TaxID=482957 RepID=UPI00399BA4A4
MTIAQQLRDELRAADTVIRNALAVMTMEQKSDWGCANHRDDVAGEGVTRYHERQVAIAGGSSLAVFLELRRADRIIGNAWEIQSFHQHALWSIANQQDGVAVTHPTRADSRAEVMAAAVAAAHELVGDARGSIADGIVGYVKSLGDVVSVESVAWFGVDFAAPGGDQSVVLKPPRDWSNADVARLRCAFTKRNHGGTLTVEQPAPRRIEEMIRFCPECGRLGDIPAGYEACCPDWSQARVVPKRFAELCAETFKLCVRRPYGTAIAPADGRAAAAVRTLEAKAYTYTDGAELWKPPLGPAPPRFSTIVEGGQV